MKLVRLLILISALAWLTTANATNGYFSHGYGTISQGMAGAGTAWSQTSIAVATNPAGMAFVGHRLDVGLQWFSPRREYQVTGGNSSPPAGTFYLQPGKVHSDSEHFFIPTFGYNRPLGRNQTLGLTIYANGGMNTDYPQSTFYAGNTGVNLEQLFISPSWTFRFSDQQSVGVAPVIAYQRFTAKGLASFAGFSSDASALSNAGRSNSWGYGIHLGWQGQVLDGLRAGVSWRSRIYMSKLHRYSGLFAQQGGFDIPMMVNAGLAWQYHGNQHLLLDMQHVWYSQVKSVGNPMLPDLALHQLGDNNGAGFGWKDMTTWKLGWQWDQSNVQSWRAGISYGRQPIPKKEVLFNILAPGVQEWHFTGGFTHRFESVELSGMVFYSPTKAVSGENPLGPGQRITLRMHQLGASLSLGWTF